MQTAVTAEKSATSTRSNAHAGSARSTFSHRNDSAAEGLSQFLGSKSDDVSLLSNHSCSSARIHLKRGNAIAGLIHPVIQTKLKIGKPNDRFEKEADHMADKVMASSVSVQRNVDERGEKDDESIMGKGAVPREVDSSLESQLSASKEGGTPLSGSTRATMEHGIGAGFSAVRVHTDSRAVQMSKGLNAQAFTHGSDIYFNEGKYNPESASGKHLLAHELTHTVQQGKSPQISKLQKQEITPKKEEEEVQSKEIGQYTAGPMVQGGWLSSAVSWVADKAKSAGRAIARGAQAVASAAMNFLDAAKERAMSAVTSLPGYALIANVTGKDPITGSPLPPQQGGILRFIFSMVGAEDYYDKIAQANIIERVTGIVKSSLAKSNISWAFIWNSLKAIWQTVTINPMTWGAAAGMAKDLFVTVFKNAMIVGKSLLTQLPPVILEGFLLLVGAPVETIMGVLRKGANTIMRIMKNPLRFVMNLVRALKAGFFQFKDNILKHLKDGLMGWLMGAMEGAGIQLPEKWDLSGILSIVLQVLGLTYERIRIKLVNALGEEKVAKLEKTFEFLKLLATGGIKALVEKAKEYISSMPGMVIDAIKSWVITKVVTAAVTKLVSFFNPAGAIIQAILAIYNSVMFFIERAKQIASLVSAVINSVASIAAGKIGDAANWIENSMARTIPVIISFLARLVGLGGISGKIKAVITKIQAKVDTGVDKIIAIVKKKATALFGKGKALVAKGKETIGAVLEWWKVKRKFKTKSGESHTLFYQKSGSSIVPMVASKEDLVKNKFKGDNFPDQKTKEKAHAGQKELAKVETAGKENQPYDSALLEELLAEVLETTDPGGGPVKVGQVAVTPKIHYSQSALKLGAKENTVGINMEAEYLASNHPQGSGPGNSQKNIFEVLPTLKNVQKPEYGSRDANSMYIKGHLLNDNLGGLGVDKNLFPITQKANQEHEQNIEADAKNKVNIEGFIVHYQVEVSGVKKLDPIKLGSDDFFPINASFLCKLSNYKKEGNALKKQAPFKTVVIHSRYKQPAIVETPGLAEKSKVAKEADLGVKSDEHDPNKVLWAPGHKKKQNTLSGG